MYTREAFNRREQYHKDLEQKAKDRALELREAYEQGYQDGRRSMDPVNELQNGAGI